MATLSPPATPVRYGNRPHARTSNSFMSTRSGRSSASGNKMDLTESPKDKKRLNTKADPSMALKEAQPAAVALEVSTMEHVRDLQHRDVEGNVITDPDRSNPTRYRLERPLDTIRAFNAAAEGTANRRSSYGPRPSPGSTLGGQDGRRSSHYGNGQFPPQQRPRPGTGGYYRSSSYGFRPDSYGEEPAPPQPPYGRPSGYQNRQQHHYPGESPASTHSYQQSYETTTSGSDDYSKSTNPSSQNSSFDRLHQMQTRRTDEYGNEIGPAPPMKNSHNGYSNGYAQPSHGAQNGGYGYQQPRTGPMPANNPRQPIQLTTSNSGPPPTAADLNKTLPQKRQSWFKRKLSRRDS